MHDRSIGHSPLARLGRWAHSRRRLVIGIWLLLAVGLGVFAPKLPSGPRKDDLFEWLGRSCGLQPR